MEKPVIFKNKNGKQLIGILHLPKGKRKFPLTVICHGFGSTKTNIKYVRLARALEKSRIASLRFDFEGCGDSEGDLEEMTIKREVSDLAAALNYALSQKNISKNKVAFLGSSLGCIVVALYIVQNSFLAKTLVFWAPALNQKKLFSIWYTKSNLRKWRKQNYFVRKEDKIGVAYLKENIEKDYSQLLSKIKIPISIIHGKKDETVPPRLSKELVRNYKNLKLILLPKADHKFENYYIQKRLVEETVRWLKKKLAP